MTLDYACLAPFGLPDRAFEDGIAVLLVAAQYQSEGWLIEASLEDRTPAGCIMTADAVARPDLALDAAMAWLNGECHMLGWTAYESAEARAECGQDTVLAGTVCLIVRPPMQEVVIGLEAAGSFDGLSGDAIASLLTHDDVRDRILKKLRDTEPEEGQ